MSKWYYITERDKQILRALAAATGIILFWRGLWGIVDNTPILSDNFVSLFVGLVILIFSGDIFTAFAGKEKIYKANMFIEGLLQKHPKKEHKKFTIFFHDKTHGKIRKFGLDEIHDIEKELIIIKLKNREYIIPAHRITKITQGTKVIWEK
jgi:uncharacterized protein (UPF0248 family)